MRRFYLTLLTNTRSARSRGFTLIELLIVIGLLGILITTVLLAISPVEAQRKARDAKRVRDLATLQAVMESWIGSGGAVPGGWTSPRNSSENGGSTDCSVSGWLGIDVCAFVSSLPVDPLNKDEVKVAGSTTSPTGCNSSTTTTRGAYYWVAYDSATNNYEVNAVQESTANCKYNNGDSGNSSVWVEVGTLAGHTLLSDPQGTGGGGGGSPTPTPSPTLSPSSTPIPTPTPSPTPSQSAVFSDSFDRPDGSLGAVWTVINSTWGISSNKARMLSGQYASTNGVTHVNVGQTEYTVSADVTLSPTYQRANGGLALGVVDYQNNIFCKIEVTDGNPNGLMSIGRKLNGTISSLLASMPNAGFVNGGTYPVICTREGNVITMTVESRVISYTMNSADLAAFGSSTRVGLRTHMASNEDDGLTTYDNFLVVDP